MDCYRYKLLYVRLMVTMKQKPILNMQKRKRKEYKHTTKESQQTTKEESKKRRNREELQKQTKNNYKMATHTYVSIITLNGLNSLIQRERVAEWIKKNKNKPKKPTTHLYVAYRRLTVNIRTHTD